MDVHARSKRQAESKRKQTDEDVAMWQKKRFPKDANQLEAVKKAAMNRSEMWPEAFEYWTKK